MLTIEILSWKGGMKLEKIAEIAWDGERFTGRGTELIFFREPIRLHGGGQVTAKSDPELFMRSLCLQYKSAYLRASKAVSS